jgi:hypothetical protein
VLIQRPAVHRSYEGLPLVLREIVPADPAANVLMMWPREVRLNDRAAALLEFATAHAERLDPRSSLA